MNGWKLPAIAFGAALIGLGAWWCMSSDPKENKADSPKVLRSRRIREAPAKPRSSRTAVRVSEQRRNAKAAAAKGNADEKWDPFSSDNDFNLDVDFVIGDELCHEMSQAVKDILARLGKAQGSFDKKGVMAAVRQLLAMMAKGENVSTFAKIQAVDALKFAGGGLLETLPEIVQLAADADPEVSQASLAALQEMLWDFETTPRQIADAIAQLVKLTDDPGIINPFVFEMTDFPNSLKVSTSLLILDSQNNAAIAALDDNKSFLFDDFDGKVQNRQDIVQYGKDHPDEKE